MRHGVHLYKCMACGRQFRTGTRLTDDEIWGLYQGSKQTIAEIARHTSLSESTIKRRLRSINIEWRQPSVTGRGVIHMDATYFGRNSGVLLVLESGTGRLLYMAHINHEHITDYEDAVKYLETQGYVIDGIMEKACRF